MTGAVHSQGEAPPQRIIHDIPPVWDGKDPEHQLEPYLKTLRGWLMTTRTLKSQAGMTILNFAQGDLKIIINELEIEEFCDDDSGNVVLKHIIHSYSEFVEKKLPAAIESCFFDKDLPRSRNEHMLQYVLRRDKLFKKLSKEGWTIPEEVKAYILLRDAHLPDKARDLIEMWTGGVYEYAEMQKYLKRLERPTPGGGARITGLCGFEEDEPQEDETATFVLGDDDDSEPQALIFMNESLFVLPEAFDDELLMEMLPYLDDPNVLFVAGDLDDETIFEESEAVALLANYGQIRNYLHKKTLNRGFFKNRPPSTGRARGRGRALKAITDSSHSSHRNSNTKKPFRRFNTARHKADVQNLPDGAHEVRKMRAERTLGTNVH